MAKEDKYLKIWKERQALAEAAQVPIYKKFKGYYDQFYAVVRNIQSPWRSKLHLPEFFSIIITKAAIMTSKPLSWEVNGRTPDDILGARVAEELLNYQIREPHVKPSHYKRFTTGVLDALVTGTAIFEVPFKMQTDTFRSYPKNEDTLQIDTSQVAVTKRIARWNEFVPIEHTRFFKDPYSYSLQDAQWVIVEDFQTVAALKAKNKQTPGYYDNLEGLDELEGASDRLGWYNQSRNNLLDSADKITLDDTVKYLRVWRTFCRKFDEKTGEPYVETSVIAGEKKTIRSPRRQENWHNQYPFAVMYDYDRPHEFWGVGEIEVNDSIVKGINDNINQYFDNKNLSNNTMIMRKASTILEPFIIEPGGEVIYDGEKPDQFRFPDPDATTFQAAHTTLLQGLERSSGVSGYLSGVPSAGIDKTRGTKGGIEQITSNANNRMGYTQRQIGDFLEQVGRIWLSNIQQYFTEEFMFRLTDGKMAEFAPEDIQGEYDLYVSDNSLTPSSKEEKLNMLMELFSRLPQLQEGLMAEGKMLKVSKQITEYLSLIGEARPEEMVGDAPPPKDDIKRNIAVTFAGDTLPNEVKAEMLSSHFTSPDDEPTEEEMPPGAGAPTVTGGMNGTNGLPPAL